jgi:tRNA nucleotidyltransferase (CCA-adding enzyme)
MNNHILHVLNNTPNNLVLRITALFHDIGKPNTYTEDKNGIGHFYNHWEESRRIFMEFAKKYNLDSHVSLLIANLIYYHDINIGKMNEFDKMKLLSIFVDEGIMMLFDFKRADLLAQSTEFNYLIDDFRKQRNDILGLERHMKYE